MRASWIAWIVVLACAAPRPAAADLRELRLAGWYGKVGVETGVAFGRDQGVAPLLGGVATLVHLNDQLEWVGVQGDVLVDWNGEESADLRWSVGPELGRSIFGIDASYAGQRLAGTTRHGLALRAKLTVGLASVYVRATYALAGADDASFDAGLQLKLPVWIRRRPPPATPVARRD